MKRNFPDPDVFLLAILLSGNASGRDAGPEGGLEPFVFSTADPSPGPADVSFLLDPPAGGKGFVEARDGHFFIQDQRIRFWGVNVCFGSCFPSHDDARRAAERLSRFGVNCVRFHHMDSRSFPGGIFADRKLEELSGEALDRLDYFISELAKRGIYANLNLHVSRWFSRAQGWPGAGELESYDKLVDIFHPDLIEAQKRYARNLLSHRNPYTGNRYAEEPAVAMVEITNEDSLFMWGSMGGLARLPDPYAGILREKWCGWLLEKYGGDDRLRKAWSAGEEPLGEEEIAGAEFQGALEKKGERSPWSCEMHEGAKARLSEAKGPEGKRAIRIEVESPTGTAWHIQFKRTGLRVKKGQTYTVLFQARAEKEKSAGLGVGQERSPWGNLGLSETLRLGPEWRPFRFGFVARADEDDVRLSFSLGGDATAAEISGVSFRPGGRSGLAEGESLSKKNLAFFPEGGFATEARIDDRLLFLAGTERTFFTGMRGFLKKELGLRAPVTGTIAFGSLGTEVQAELDFVDQHAYWQHPDFPRRPWDSRDWTISNRPMSAARDGGTLPGLASTRVLGKPYTVTEYNHPAPLDSQAETVPMIASFAAEQDWDGVFLFAYSHSGEFDRDRIQGFFDIDANPAKMGFLGAGALIFLGPRLEPAGKETVLRLSPEDRIEAARLNPTHLEPFISKKGFSMDLLLGSRWAIAFEGKASTPFGREKATPSALRWIREGGGEGGVRYVVDAPALKVICGQTKGPLDLGEARLEVESPASASIVLVSVDREPLSRARRILLVACGRCENTGMEWNADRSSVADRWGRAPCLIEPVRGKILLKGDPVRQVLSLDGRGQKQAKIRVEKDGNGSSFPIGGDPPTLWYEISR